MRHEALGWLTIFVPGTEYGPLNVPYNLMALLQAILSPEVDVGRGELFSISLRALLDGASSGIPESRLHCLNILRNIYRESRFNQLIGPYVARGLMVAITGFEASDWPVIPHS